MKIYRARSFGIVNIHDDVGASTVLNPRLDVARISPTGLAWGYFGPGSKQLALALICDVTGNHLAAVDMHEEFARRALATMNRDAPFEITYKTVADMLLKIDTERKARARERSGGLAGGVGVEPTTRGVGGRRSTTELHSRKNPS